MSLKAWRAYLGPDHENEVSTYAAPARATDLSDLPPAYISAAGLDLLRDEDILYAMNLMQAGVSTELHVFPSVPHGFEFFPPGITVGKRALLEYSVVLKRALHR